MPAISNIVIADAVPANHTFVPQSASMALSTWMTTAAATYEGNSRIGMVMSPPSKARPTTRERITLAVPFERTVEGVVSVPDTILFTADAVIPSACSAAEALKGYTLFKNLLAHAMVLAYMANREPAY